ncbi:MAG: diguanylate cyclase [Chloroflexi bacterium]|nr:diguanylate cyclase [Chloroflexota bacterium]
MNIYYAIALIFSGTISITVALTAWQRRNAPGAVGLALFMLGCAVWALTYAIRWLAVVQSSQIFWLDTTYLGVVAVPFGTVVFTLGFTHRFHLLTRRNLFLLAIEPVLTLILLWTDNLHGLFFGGLHTTGTILNGGPWFWIHIAYSYFIYLLMIVLIAREYGQVSHLYRRQAGTILVGMLLPWIGNVVSLAGLSPFRDLDITPFIFILTGVFFNFGLFRYGLLDILPVAYDRLIESLPDGVIVLDVRKRIVEINPAARRITGVGLKEIGQSAEMRLAHWPALKAAYQTTTEFQQELRISENPPCDIEVRVSPLFDRRQNPSGLLIVLRDITERKQMEEKLKQLSIKDVLTGLYNRAYFESEIARLERGRQYPISLILVDVDKLKTVNDRDGHSAGDVVLKRTAQVLNAAFRAEDIITRIGGDEFVVILPNTSTMAAAAAGERLQRVLKDHNATHAELPLSFSVGISTAEISTLLTEAFKAADEEMYREKRIHQGSYR